MGKHAYLIEAHNNRNQLETLLKCLDYKNNDIFIHIDAKSKDFKDLDTNNPLKYSKLIMINSMNVSWGGFSQIFVELQLLEKALDNRKYERYHLISGGDLPLKTQDEIHAYFNKNQDIEYVHFDYVNSKQIYEKRMAQYHFFRDKIDRSQKIMSGIEKLLIFTQKLLRVNRIKNINMELVKGSNWFSITDECARYIISKKEWIFKTFKYTKCCDEVFLQTLVYNSKFKDYLYYDEYEDRCSAMRFLDWKRGNPYTFTKEDFGELTSSHYMFARKFDEKLDKEIINKIYNYIKN